MILSEARNRIMAKKKMPHKRIGTVEAIVATDTERIDIAELFDPALLEACREITPAKTISLSELVRDATH